MSHTHSSLPAAVNLVIHSQIKPPVPCNTKQTLCVLFSSLQVKRSEVGNYRSVPTVPCTECFLWLQPQRVIISCQELECKQDLQRNNTLPSGQRQIRWLNCRCGCYQSMTLGQGSCLRETQQRSCLPETFMSKEELKGLFSAVHFTITSTTSGTQPSSASESSTENAGGVSWHYLGRGSELCTEAADTSRHRTGSPHGWSPGKSLRENTLQVLTGYTYKL